VVICFLYSSVSYSADSASEADGIRRKPEGREPQLSTTTTRPPLAGAHIGSSVLIKGELSGREDLYLDGEVEGTIELRECSLTVGTNGRVRGNVHGKSVIVQGRIEGDISGSQRVELRNSGVVIGDITTERILIEDGAVFKGKLETADRSKDKADGAHAAAKAQAPISSSAAPTGAAMQASFLDKA
jgi:cytoskeletal protein CcmA (bactofilin family)